MASVVVASKFLFTRTSLVSAKSFATISFSKNGGLNSDKFVASTTPVDAKHLKVSIKASAVNVEDVRGAHGLSLNSNSSGIAGSSGSGVVTAVPAGNSTFAVGDNVLVVGEGVWTDEVVISEANATKIPKLSSEEAAMLPNFAAAWGILHNFASLKAGDVVVQTNGNGAVGAAISQVGKALGYKVVSVNAADITAAKLQEAGSIKLAVSGHSGRHISALQKAVGTNGVTVSYNGTYEPVSTVSGVQLPISQLIFNNTSLNGFDLNAWAATSPEAFRAGLTSVLKLVEEKKVVLKPAHVFPQSDFRKAVEEVAKTGASVALKH